MRYFIITSDPGIGNTTITAHLTQVRELVLYIFCIAWQIETA
jgi:hypothetical protein